MAVVGNKPDLAQMLHLSLMLLLFAKYGAANSTRVCTFYESIPSNSLSPSVTLQVVVYLNNAAVSGSGLSTKVDLKKIDSISFDKVLYSHPSENITIHRTIQMMNSAAKPPTVLYETQLSYGGTGNGTNITSLVLQEDLGSKMQAFWSNTFQPGLLVPGVIVTNRQSVTYNVPFDLAEGSVVTLAFEAEPAGEQGQALQAGVSSFHSFMKFISKGLNITFTTTHDVCLDTTYIYNSNIYYEHGYTALSFFVALLFGVILVVLAVLLYLLICRRRLKSSVSPSEYDEKRMRAKGKKIVLDPKAALRKGINAIKDYSIMGWNESIILILSLKDKLHMFKEIDNLDVLATIYVDTDLEQEQNEASTQTSILLIQGLRHNRDISREVENKAVSNYNNNLKELEKKLDAEYKKDLEGVYTDLSAKNKEKLAELLQKHRQQKAQIVTMSKELPEKEREDLMKLIDKQQQIEENGLTFMLSLEQNEAAEKLRKEFAIRKRMEMKELQQNMVTEVTTEGKLNGEQADWLLKEYKKQQEAVHRMYDDEISRQRMILEEKLAKRRALAQASEIQGDDANKTLNLTASHIIGYLQKGKNSTLTAEQSEEWIEEMKVKALSVKHEMDTVNESQETELHKKLSQAKVLQLNELIKNHEGEIQEYIKKGNAQQTQGPVDPVSYAEGLLKLRSQHRVELANAENQVDAENAKQLKEARAKVSTVAHEKLKDLERETVKRLQEKGLTEKALNGLLKKHEEEKEVLRQTQEKNLRNQEDKLKEELARRRREWTERREHERKEQEELREHETEVVEKLVNSQVSMSKAERDRIMKEHEKQMVMLENSLTLNKLRQQRSLEERLNQKRAQQLNILQQEQKMEVAKHLRAAENNGEEDDVKTHRATLLLMKKQAEKRIAVMQGNQLNIDEELEQIRVEMMMERAMSLKSQEERLSSMITALQMEKAREMTRIEEQQRAINNLKANLMDDLNERGILSTSDCDHILDIHRQETVALNKRMEQQRAQQEQMLKAKLQERLTQRENLILARHETEMRNLFMESNKFSSKVRRVMLIHKHMVEIEKFRNRIDREIAQSLADTEQQSEVTMLQKRQEQELAFVAGLVRVGGFEQNELLDILHMLFPNKTEEDVQQVLACITEGVQKPTEQDGPKGIRRKDSTIVERVYQSQYSGPSLLNRSGSTSFGGSYKKKQQLSKNGSSSALTYPGAGDLGTIKEPNYALQGPVNGDLGYGYNEQRNRPGSSRLRPGSASRVVAAYENDYRPISARNFNAQSNFTAPLDNRAPRFADNNYTNGFDEGVDYISMGAGMSHGNEREVPSGRLPPLGSREEGAGKKKKKKKGMLKKRTELHDDDDELL